MNRRSGRASAGAGGKKERAILAGLLAPRGGAARPSAAPRLLRLTLLLGGVATLLFLATAGFVWAARFPALELPPGRPPTTVAGVFHVHAEASHDGHGTLDEAARAAAASGARFLVLTEHERLRPEAPELRSGVVIVPGVELSTEAGHVIALGLSALPTGRGAGVLEAISAAGASAILAHPVNLRRPYTDGRSDGFGGFEALSLDSAFREAVHAPWRLFLPAAALVGDPRKTGALLLRRPGEALARYDELSATRPVTLLCGVDAHGLPAYPASFGALRLHVRLGVEQAARFGEDAGADAAAVRGAIRDGAVFCSVPALGDASAFELSVTGDAPAVLRVMLPSSDATLVLYREGVEVARGPGPALRLSPVPPGSYRAEVLVSPGFPWADDSLFVTSSSVTVAAVPPQAPEEPADP